MPVSTSVSGLVHFACQTTLGGLGIWHGQTLINYCILFLWYDNVVRMNFSHGSYEYHQSVIDNTRKMVAGTFSQFSALPVGSTRR